MILSDREIRAAVARGLIGLDPLPAEGTRRWSATTVDLTLDAEIRPWEVFESVGEEQPTITPGSPGFNADQLIRRYTAAHDCTNGFVVQPQKLVLGWTVERLKLPPQSRIG